MRVGRAHGADGQPALLAGRQGTRDGLKTAGAVTLIQAPDGRRMSKSLGTGIDPLHLIDGGPRPQVFARKTKGGKLGDPGAFPAYGADAVRFGLLAMSSTQDVRFSEEKIAQTPFS